MRYLSESKIQLLFPRASLFMNDEILFANENEKKKLLCMT